MSASLHTIAALFPPSSSDTFLRLLSAAAIMIRRPTSVLPVNAIYSIAAVVHSAMKDAIVQGQPQHVHNSVHTPALPCNKTCWRYCTLHTGSQVACV
eukprot:3620-Heterococcus_DN1.PRE.7